MTHPPAKIDIPAAWRGSDLAVNPQIWTSTLSSDEIAELEESATRFLARSNDPGQISPASFPLPTLARRFTQLRQTLNSGIGFELICGWPVRNYPTEFSATVFYGIGAHIGAARSQNAQGHLLGHVRDTGADANDPDTRIYQTTERQSFHTDSVDVVGLLCLQDAREGGDSLLASTATIYNEIQKRRPDLIKWLFQPVATDRRGETPEGEKPWFEIPVLNWYEGHLTGLYQRQYIESAQRFADAPRLTDAQIEALDLFDAIANEPDIYLCMRLAPGDMQFVYNHSNLHDRTGFQDWPDRNQRRHLLRLWLALPQDRLLPPIFSQRYGSTKIGERGGIMTKGTQPNVPLVP